MAEKHNNSVRSILAAPVKALSAKQISVMTIFLLGSVALYQAGCYLAYLADGQSLSSVYSVYGLLSFSLPGLMGLAGWFVWGGGLVAAVLSIMLGLFAVAAINIEELRGNRFLSVRATLKFAISRLGQLFFAEFTVVGFVLFAVLLFSLFGLVSRLPFVGEWIYTLLFVLPTFVIAILITFAIFVLSLMIILLPAVAAADRKGETFGAVVESFSTILRQPSRWFGWTAYSLVVAKLSSFVYAYFCYRAVQFMVGASMLGGGEQINRLIKSGMSHLPAKSDFVDQLFTLFPGFDFSFSIDYWTRGHSNEPVSYVMAFMLFVIFATVIGYFLSIVATAQAHIYVMIRREKDDYDIASEEPLFFKDPWVNQEINETDGTGNAD